MFLNECILRTKRKGTPKKLSSSPRTNAHGSSEDQPRIYFFNLSTFYRCLEETKFLGQSISIKHSSIWKFAFEVTVVSAVF